MTKFCALFSGSSGNCAYIESGGSAILIDAGVSTKAIGQALEAIGSGLSRISAVFVTHEHSDHIRGLPVLASRYGIPVYANTGTMQGILAESGGRIGEERLSEQTTGCCVEIGDLCVSSFATSHDSRESVGYRIHTGDGHRLAVATDLGYISETVMDGLTDCEIVMLESNHDIGMLQNGRYPYFLKRRILSDHGHLSNDGCAQTLPVLLENGAKHLILAHLSRDNNLPELAYETSACSLKMSGARIGTDCTLETAPRNGPGVVYSL